MYKAFYGLTLDPFDKNIDASQIYESSVFKEFIARMEYFKAAKGFAAVYGEPGSGKTTGIRTFASRLNPQLFKIVYLPLTSVTVNDFYRSIVRGLGIVPSSRKIDMFHQIQQYVLSAHHEKKLTPFLIIDEAQFIHHDILHDLRILFNFQMDSQNYCMVLLSGQPRFIDMLDLNIHEPLRQRITIHHRFTGLPKNEVRSYVSTLLKRAGTSEPIFTPDAIEALATFTRGLPRKINQLAEKSLILGCQKESRTISSEIVQLAQEEIDFIRTA
jgi:type II secretory pathway predicted ATPase ExeA